MKYNYKEAFALMKYQSKDGKTTELIWNSRDGITPFTVQSKDGKKMMQHVDWHLDKCQPDHELQVGDRYFCNLTKERAIEIANKRLDSVIGTSYEVTGKEREEMFAKLVDSMTRNEHGTEVDIATKK